MNVIIAPHIDDEVIGCYSLLRSGMIDKIIYCFDLTEERKKEAWQVKENFNIAQISFEGIDFIPADDDVLYIPNKNDAHDHHKIVNNKYRTHTNVFYYSVDMNRKKPLDEIEASFKKDVLNDLFPSQKMLWLTDAKYYLFEDISINDDKVMVYCKEQFEAIHYWKDADNYLKYAHRHIFYVKLFIEVWHDDREIEFIQLKNKLKQFLDENYQMQEFQKSCEMIGKEIKDYFTKLLPLRDIQIDVSEDNENGIIII